MKNAIKIVIKEYVINEKGKEKLINNKHKYRCGYCDSGQIYFTSNGKEIFCRNCGKKSEVKNDNRIL